MTNENIIVIGMFGALGKAITKECIKNDCTVYGISKNIQHDTDDLSEVEHANRLNFYQCDITDEVAINNVLRNIYDSAGKIDYVYICTGIKEANENTDYWESVRKTINVNLNGVINCLEAIERFSTNYVKVVIISSMGDVHGMVGTHGYNASKAALTILCESLQFDYWKNKKDMSIQVVRPGLISSSMANKSNFSKIMSMSPECAAKIIKKMSNKNVSRYGFPVFMSLFTFAIKILPIKMRYFILLRAINDK